MSLPFDCYAITALGIEAITAREIAALGITPTLIESGGVEFRGAPAQLYAANLHLRTATRVVVRVAEFGARTFFELERHARKVEWERFVPAGGTIAFSVTSRKSKLYHQGAIEERLRRWVEEAGFEVRKGEGEKGEERGEGEGTEGEGTEGEEEGKKKGAAASSAAVSLSPSPLPPSSFSLLPSPQLFLIRLHRDRVTISADSSGELLHRRGYRLATAKAPLRETLAAAMLLASSWDGTVPLLDPFCGSGTIPIEGALIARNIAPGIRRRFAFEGWSEFDAEEWRGVRERAVNGERSMANGVICGSDRDAGAIVASNANAGRAGVAENVAFRTAPVSDLDPGGATVPGWLLTNPPWGVRIGEEKKLRDLYARLGEVCQTRFRGWNVGLFSASRILERATGLDLEERFATRSGGIEVRCVVGRVGGR